MAPDDVEYDFWLFDLDGTLVDVDPAYARSVFDRVGDRLGASFTDEEVTILWHGLHGSRDRTLRRKGIDPGAFWEAFHSVEDPQARAEATYLYDDAAFVGDLDVPVGVVTHCQRYLAEPVVERLDVRDWFDALVCCTDDLGWKPDPAPVHRAMREMGVAGPRGEAVATDGGVGAGAGAGVLAGDGPSDIGAAWNAGLDGIHVERHGHELRRGCVRGDLRVRSFDDLPL
jgi:phosphoglycolate phosphatase